MFFQKIKLYMKALLRAKRYDNIVMLGYNCEIAYRFFRQYKFIDSSLFAWTYVPFEQLKYFFESPEKVGVGEFSFGYGMFTCENSGIAFHGRTDWSGVNDINQLDKELVETEKKELRSRISYLKDKFFKYSTDGKKTLYIRKISAPEAVSSDLNDNINWLYRKLQSFCSNDFKLLLVIEKQYENNVKISNSNIILRTVEKYSNDKCVTSRNEGDKFGWRLIFTEFQPAKIKKQSKKLKFEEIN